MASRVDSLREGRAHPTVSPKRKTRADNYIEKEGLTMLNPLIGPGGHHHGKDNPKHLPSRYSQATVVAAILPRWSPPYRPDGPPKDSPLPKAGQRLVQRQAIWCPGTIASCPSAPPRARIHKGILRLLPFLTRRSPPRSRLV